MSIPTQKNPLNAQYIEVYSQNGVLSTVTTYCQVNKDFQPPFVTNLTPIDESLFMGQPIESYIQIVATGEIITSYQGPASGGQSMKLG